jgi:hypothetical protein
MPRPNDFLDHREIEREVLAQPAFAGGSLKFVKPISARHSQLWEYIFLSNGQIRPIVLKHQTFARDPELATVKEFANLSKVRNMLGGGLEQSVPEPLLALPKKGILVTSKLPGTPLTATLKKYGNRLCGPFSVSAIRETAQRAGKWLKTFQDATRSEPLAFDTDSFLADLEGRLSRLHSRGFELGLAAEILKHVSLQIASFDGKLIPAAARHGDFIAQNVLIEGDRVGVVDFEGFAERDAVYEDLGTFLGYLLVLGTRLPYSPPSLEAARLGFLSGFSREDAIDRAFWNIYILKGSIRIITDGPHLKNTWGWFGMAGILTEQFKRLASGSA